MLSCFLHSAAFFRLPSFFPPALPNQGSHLYEAQSNWRHWLTSLASSPLVGLIFGASRVLSVVASSKAPPISSTSTSFPLLGHHSAKVELTVVAALILAPKFGCHKRSKAPARKHGHFYRPPLSVLDTRQTCPETSLTRLEVSDIFFLNFWFFDTPWTRPDTFSGHGG